MGITAAQLMSNRSILAKADMALSDLQSDGGMLQPATALKFMRILIKEAVAMKSGTVVPLKSPKQIIDKIRFGSRMLRAGYEGQALPKDQRAKPDLFQVEFDAKLFKAEVRLNNEVLEDSIERGQLRQTIMQLMAERISVDMDDISINSDTTSSNPDLGQFDGLLKQATTNIFDNLNGDTDKDLFDGMVKKLPSEYLRNRKLLRLMTSVKSELDYRNSLAERATVVGDKFLETDAPVLYAGIPVQSIPMFPEDLGMSTNQTNALLADPKNMNWGMWRQIRIQTDSLASEGVLIIVATIRFDVKWAHEPAVVRGTNILVA
jgi:hypothetical protein